MNKVITLERRRSLLWLRKFWLIITVFFALVVSILFNIVVELWQQGSLDWLEIFSEDQEVFKDYFGEVLFTFFLELPWERILLVALILLGTAFFLFLTRNRLQIIRLKLKQITHYEKN